MARTIDSIVVGVATIDELDPVLPSAIRLAESVGAALHIVHVLPAPEPVLELGGFPLDTARFDEQCTAVRARLAGYCARFASAPERLRIHILSGSPHRELAHLAADFRADLLVVGATRRGRIWRNILGTTAERVLRESTIPVLVLHQPFFRPVERVLLTSDLSEHSARVHDRALDLVEGLFGADRIDCRSVLVLGYHIAPPPPLNADAAEEIGQLGLRRFLDERTSREYSVAARVRTGEAAVEINVEADAWGADLIVLGTHSRKGWQRYLLGSVAASTLRDATRNALVVPPVCEESAAGLALRAVGVAPPLGV